MGTSAAVVEKVGVSASHCPPSAISQISQMVWGVKLATLQSQTLLTSLQATAALRVDW